MFKDLRKQITSNNGIPNSLKKEFLEKIDKAEIDLLIRTAPTDIKRLIYDFTGDKQYENILKKRKEKELDSLIRTAPKNVKKTIYNFTGDNQHKRKLLIADLEFAMEKLDSEKLDKIFSDIKIYKKKFGEDLFIIYFQNYSNLLSNILRTMQISRIKKLYKKVYLLQEKYT